MYTAKGKHLESLPRKQMSSKTTYREVTQPLNQRRLVFTSWFRQILLQWKDKLLNAGNLCFWWMIKSASGQRWGWESSAFHVGVGIYSFVRVNLLFIVVCSRLALGYLYSQCILFNPAVLSIRILASVDVALTGWTTYFASYRIDAFLFMNIRLASRVIRAVTSVVSVRKYLWENGNDRVKG